MHIGTRIRMIRKSQNRTMQEIADSCDFTKSLLSKIETGKTMPALGTLSKIASTLGVKMSTLADEKKHIGAVYTPKNSIEASDMTEMMDGFYFYSFASEKFNKQMQPYLFEVKKGMSKDKPVSHTGEEFIYILKGQMRFRVGDIEYILRPGDSLYFDSEEEHTRDPITDTVQYLLIMSNAPEIREKE